MAVIEAISTVYLEADGAEASYIIWDDIPSTYEHLEIRMNAQSDRASYGNDAVLMRLGDTGHSPVDTGANYSYEILETDSSTSTTAQRVTGATSMYVGRIATGFSGAANFGTCVISVLDYANANKNTTVMGSGGMVSTIGTTANSVKVRFASGLWDDVSVVNAILLNPVDGTSWLRGSEFTLYGLKNS
jgi:hypothetical protein